MFYYRKELLNARKGGAQPNISQHIVNNVSIPLPPLQEQDRIVSKLEELFTKLDAGIDALKKTKIQLKNYERSLLHAACSGYLTADWRDVHTDIQPVSDFLKMTLKERKEGYEGIRKPKESKKPTRYRDF